MFDLIIVKPLANVLFAIYAIVPGHDYGIAVILITALIRFALWPLLASQLKSQKKLQALQPEIAKLRAETKGDKQKESAALMELYKEKEINPLASCLPLLIQLPFLIGLYAVFMKTAAGVGSFEHLLYGPIKQLPQIAAILNDHDLFKPYLLGIINLAAKGNIFLAVLAGASQFVQVYQISPKQFDKDDPNATITKMTTWLFPFLTGYIGFTLTAALPLYWSVSNGVSILQQYIIMRGEVEHMEEAEVVKTTVRTVEKPAQLKSGKTRKRGK